jgi:hypothetical protein
LTRQGRVDSHHLPSSFFRFGLQAYEEHRPRGIGDRLCQFRICEHGAHDQSFDGDAAKASHQLAHFWLDEGLAPVGNLFVGAHIGTGFEANVPANFFMGRRHLLFLTRLFAAFSADRHEPFAGGSALDESRFRGALDRPMHDHLHVPSFCQYQDAPLVLSPGQHIETV